MKLKINSVENKGDLSKEVVWIDVLQDVANYGDHLLCDTTYTENDKISAKLRHLFWLPDGAAAKGDFIAVHTGAGTKSSAKNKKGTMTHNLYWGLKETVWNKDGDCALL
jgi:hypothetical protein